MRAQYKDKGWAWGDGASEWDVDGLDLEETEAWPELKTLIHFGAAQGQGRSKAGTCRIALEQKADNQSLKQMPYNLPILPSQTSELTLGRGK